MNHDQNNKTLADRQNLLPLLLIICGTVAVVMVCLNFTLIGKIIGYGGPRMLLGALGFLAVSVGIYLKIRYEGRRLNPLTLLMMSVWFGMIAGIGKVLVLMVKTSILKLFINFDPQLIWMQPAGSLILFGLTGLVLAGIAWRRPQAVSMHSATFGLSFLMFLSCLTSLPKLHVIAQLVLIIGLAAALSRFAVLYSNPFLGLVRRTITPIAALLVFLFLGVHAWEFVPEHLALKNLPPADANDPNVLVIVMDTVRAENLSLYGYSRPTSPNLEQLSRSGVNFEHAFSVSPWTLPAHAAMFSGRLPHELFGEGATPLDLITPVGDKFPMLAEALGRRGYATAGFVANVGVCSRAHGLSRGFVHYEDYVFSPELLVSNVVPMRKLFRRYRRIMGNQEQVGRKTAEDINRSFLAWLSRRPDRPFFAFLNYFDAHDPYLPPAPFDSKFGSESPKIARVRHFHEYTTAEINRLRDAYDGGIAYIDHHIGALLEELGNLGILDSTLIIVTSDHGEQFGEHGLMYHSNSLYSQLLHVPLIISYPNHLPGNKRVAEPVSLLDLPQTVMGLVTHEDRNVFPGRSLDRHWDSPRPVNSATETVLSEVLISGQVPEWIPKSWPVSKGGMKSVVSQDHHLIREGDGLELLYDFVNDSKEEHELLSSDGEQPLHQLLNALLDESFE